MRDWFTWDRSGNIFPGYILKKIINLNFKECNRNSIISKILYRVKTSSVRTIVNACFEITMSMIANAKTAIRESIANSVSLYTHISY